jgi:hypothetical protein
VVAWGRWLSAPDDGRGVGGIAELDDLLGEKSSFVDVEWPGDPDPDISPDPRDPEAIVSQMTYLPRCRA